MLETSMKRKVFAYITRGRRVLLLGHPDHPEAGIQVPAGTMRPDESVCNAALREATEETGLTGLEVKAVLGEHTVDVRPFGRNEIHHRTFMHLTCADTTPESWEHWECDPEGLPGEKIRFRLYWVSLDEPIPDLVAGHDAFIAELHSALDSGNPARR